MMDRYSIVYIDDNPDPVLSEYLGKKLKIKNCKIESHDIRFNPDEGYNSLLTKPTIQTANIILIDYMLFENRTAIAGKFTGGEFQLILKKIFPFIEVILITQKEIPGDIIAIPKYDKQSGRAAEEYYAEIIPPCIEKTIESIRNFRTIANKIKEDCAWDKVLIDKVRNSLNGITTYDDLKTSDINNIIDKFKEIEKKLDGLNIKE